MRNGSVTNFLSNFGLRHELTSHMLWSEIHLEKEISRGNEVIGNDQGLETR